MEKQKAKCGNKKWCRGRVQGYGNGVCEILWLKRILEELKLNLEHLMKLFCDNKTTISITNNPIQCNHVKHVEISRHFIKEKLESGIICMSFITTRQ